MCKRSSGNGWIYLENKGYVFCICSAKMMWVGPSQKFNKPEARKYSFIIKNSSDNVYLREDGIKCLVNHEIGSHYVSLEYC